MPSRSPSLTAMGQDRFDVSQSRSVRSVWVWRAFLLMALVAAGIAILFAGNALYGYAIGWGVIAAGWFGISMWLWKMHNDYEIDQFGKQ